MNDNFANISRELVDLVASDIGPNSETFMRKLAVLVNRLAICCNSGILSAASTNSDRTLSGTIGTLAAAETSIHPTGDTSVSPVNAQCNNDLFTASAQAGPRCAFPVTRFECPVCHAISNSLKSYKTHIKQLQVLTTKVQQSGAAFDYASLSKKSCKFSRLFPTHYTQLGLSQDVDAATFQIAATKYVNELCTEVGSRSAYHQTQDLKSTVWYYVKKN
jgi:hypothetical protein